MNTNLRRSQRYNDFISVSVVVRNKITGNKEIGPYSGRLINISRHGACILMSLGTLESYNVYRSTCDTNSMFLEIEGSSEQEDNNFILSGRPLWVDPFIIDDLRAFKMGVEFNSEMVSQEMNNIFGDIKATATDHVSDHYGEK